MYKSSGWKFYHILTTTQTNSPATSSLEIIPRDSFILLLKTVKVKAATCLIQDVKQTVIDTTLGVDSNTVVVLIHPTVTLQEKVFEGHGRLLLIGHHQLIVEAEQDELCRPGGGV